MLNKQHQFRKKMSWSSISFQLSEKPSHQNQEQGVVSTAIERHSSSKCGPSLDILPQQSTAKKMDVE